MRNFKILDNNITAHFVLQEISEAKNNNIIPKDFGVLARRLNFLKRALPLNNISGKQHRDPHLNSGWISLVRSFEVDPLYAQLCNENSSYLLKTEYFSHFPQTIEFLQTFAKSKHSQLQRVVLVSLLPDKDVLPHRDLGEYFKIRDRYHLVLQSQSGSEFTAGTEKQIFYENQLWWFNNKEMHSVKNLGDSPRIHLIFDLLPNDNFSTWETLHYKILNYFFQTYNDLYGTSKFIRLINKNRFLRNKLLSK